MAKKGIAILGSTGSIGKQTLEVISSYPSKFSVVGLSAKGNIDLIEAQIKKFKPRLASVGSEDGAKKLISKLGKTNTTVYFDDMGAEKMARHPETDILVVSIPGTKALMPATAALKAGKRLALASKEILVAAGDIVMREAKGRIVPIDSEHIAIMQCLKDEDAKKVKRIILTASGGAFLNRALHEIENATAKDALSHPTWNMGKKITVDSATLMNKGFEVIEAHHLFGIPPEKIEVLIHPQSIVHSIVEFTDGSMLAQMSAPDMRITIQYALFGGERIENNWPKLDLSSAPPLTFLKVDNAKFPCLALAYEALKVGGTLAAVMSAADEEAVSFFLNGRIKFTDISKLIKAVMDRHSVVMKPSIEDIIEADSWARSEAIKACA